MNPSVRLFPSFLLAAVLSALFLSAARADEAESSTIKFSDPSKPGTIKLTVTNGSLHIRGADAPNVTVRTELKPEQPSQRKDGLRVLTSSSSYSLTEKDNVVTLSYGTESWPSGSGDFDVTVPRNTNVVVANSFGGDIEIGDVTGNVEIKSLNGEVRLSHLVNSTLVETMNGEIHADIQAIAADKPLSFTSMNGEVQLTLNPEIKANVRLRTHNGSILTDFDDKQLVTKTASLKGEGGRHGTHSADNANTAEIRAAVRDAVRVGVEAAREATRAAREAVREARASSGRDKDDDNDDDHDEEATPDVPVPPVPPLPPMTGGKIVTGTLNGGGAELRVSTMNGDVTLRKAEK